MAKLTVFIIAIVISVALWNVPEWGPALSAVAFLSCLTVSMIPAAIYDALVRRAERKELAATLKQALALPHGKNYMGMKTIVFDSRSVNNYFIQSNGDLPPEEEYVFQGTKLKPVQGRSEQQGGKNGQKIGCSVGSR